MLIIIVMYNMPHIRLTSYMYRTSSSDCRHHHPMTKLSINNSRSMLLISVCCWVLIYCLKNLRLDKLIKSKVKYPSLSFTIRFIYLRLDKIIKSKISLVKAVGSPYTTTVKTIFPSLNILFVKIIILEKNLQQCVENSLFSGFLNVLFWYGFLSENG
uniref:Uncharacterized protein n=1 Tax=Cacopsylla melanoneura TaxID=428564 RepID=A0A8D8XB10_9HEMI